MAKIRIAVEINKGRKGAPLRKMAAICSDLNGFLVKAARDLGIELKEEFHAYDFENRSFAFKTESNDIEEQKAELFKGEVVRLVHYKPQNEQWSGRFSPGTLEQYWNVAQHLDAGEVLDVAVLDSANDQDWDSFEWLEITKDHGREVVEAIRERVDYYGAVMGKVHAWFKGSEEPHFTIREVVNNQLVKCLYSEADYNEVHKLFEDKEGYVHVAGMVTANRIKSVVECIRCERFASAPHLDKKQVSGLLGSVGGITGDLSTEEFIQRIRDED